MTHEEYVEISRHKARDCARAILENRCDILDGARELITLLKEAELADANDDRETMILIESETDALPSTSRAGNWAPEALAEQQPALDRARLWAFEEAEDALRRIASLP